MPILTATERAERREYLKSLRKGDFITLDCPPGAVTHMATSEGWLSMRSPGGRRTPNEKPEKREFERRFCESG